MDPMNGEILALANAPTFDLNDYRVATDEEKLNRAAQHIYEPGSTFKSFIAAAALEVLHMPTTRMFDVSAGSITFGPRKIHDMHRYGPLSFMDMIVKSSNVGAIKIGQALGSEIVSRYVYRFGFGETLARDIPYQRAGLVDKPCRSSSRASWRRCRWATRSASRRCRWWRRSDRSPTAAS